MVEAMKPGSVVVDLAAERGGNCDLTVPDQAIETANGVRIIGYTDFPSRMATQASTLYSTNIRHMMDDLTPAKDGNPVVNMEDDVIRGATVTHDGAVTFPPPPPKVQAIAKAAPKKAVVETAEAEGRARDRRAQGRRQPPDLPARRRRRRHLPDRQRRAGELHAALHRLRAHRLRRLPGDLERAHSLHTPLMAITNAISSIIILGALLQVGSSSAIVTRPRGAVDPDGLGQHLRRLPGDAPDAGHVPEKLSGGRHMNIGLVTAAYLAAAVLFILALGGLSNQEKAKRAIWYGIVGMALAVLATILGPGVSAHWLIAADGVLGGIAGAIVAAGCR